MALTFKKKERRPPSEDVSNPLLVFGFPIEQAQMLGEGEGKTCHILLVVQHLLTTVL